MASADPQRTLVYEAERIVASMIDRRAQFPVLEAFGSRFVVPDDRKFGDIPSVQRYVDAVLALDWVHRLAPEQAASPAIVRARRGASRAEYEFATRTIAVPPHDVGGRWAMREIVVLHEIAHHLVGPAADADGGAHGPLFVARMLELVDGILGTEAAFLLRASLLDAGVRIA